MAVKFHGTKQLGGADDEIDLAGLIRRLWAGRFRILMSMLVCAALAAWYALMVAEGRYASQVELVLDVKGQQVVDIDSVIAGTSTDEAAINTELEIIMSRNLLLQVVKQLDLTVDTEFNPSLQETSWLSLSMLRKSILEFFGAATGEALNNKEVLFAVTDNLADVVRAAVQRNTYILVISVTTSDPDKSALIANTLAHAYLNDQLKVKSSATEEAVVWLSEKVSDLEADLKVKEDQIRELRSETDLVNADALEMISLRAKELRERISNAETATANARQNVTAITEMMDTQDREQAAALLGDAILQRLLPEVRTGAADAIATFDTRLETLRQKAENSLAQNEAQRQTLSSSYDVLQEQFSVQSADLLELQQFEREAEATRVLYETFLARFKETSVQIGLQIADSRILSEAIPGVRVAPQRSKILALGMFLGLVFGASLVLLEEMLRRGFMTVEELEAATGVNVLAQVPMMPIKNRDGLLDYLRDKPASQSAEATRNLRTSLIVSRIDNPPKVIMSTSSIPGEGKTTQAISLAYNYSKLEKRVLLLEGDIRRRTFSQYFDMPQDGGLMPVLLGHIGIEDAVYRDPRSGLEVLSGQATNTNAADLFSSVRYAQFLDELRQAYDYIIIDTPPVLVVPDARIIGPMVDAIIYAVHWNSTPRQQVIEGLREFSSVGIEVNGLVLSQIDLKQQNRYSYGYDANYGNTYYQ